MNFFAVLLLSLFILVKSSSAAKDGIFDKNTKINMKSSIARAQDGTFHENAKTINVNSSTATEDGTFHADAKRNGNAGLKVVLRNDVKQESQLTRFRRSVSHSDDSLNCYSNYFVKGIPPTYSIKNSRYICQGLCSTTGKGCFSTLYDVSYKIPIYSAYVLRRQQWKDIGKFKRSGWRKETPKAADIGSPDPYIKQLNQNIDSMYSNTGNLPSIHKGHLVPAETYSFSAKNIRSTFVYTNAVPQYGKFNSGQWATYERKIRKYGKNRCAKIHKGDLYLLTGTSDHRIGRNFKTGTVFDKGIPAGTPKRMSAVPKIVIPNSMWTAACCVKGTKVLGSFAVIGNNDPINIYMSEVYVKELEGIIGVNLFPGNGGCNDINKDVNI